MLKGAVGLMSLVFVASSSLAYVQQPSNPEDKPSRHENANGCANCSCQGWVAT
jgi:hypothetical protein